MDFNYYDNTKIKEIISRRFLSADNETIKLFPKVLENHHPAWKTIHNEKLFAIFFLSNEESQIIRKIQTKYNIPFPGLYSMNSESPALFHFKNSHFTMIQDLTVKDFRAFSIGQDSSIVIKNFTVDINTENKERIFYTISLAYILSFGEEITTENIYEHLDSLIAYSIKNWRQTAGIS
jgi:hypothetical protein